MKRATYRPRVPAAGRVGLTILATAVGLLLALVVVTAQASPDFDSSYKTGPQYADLDDVIYYTIVAVNTGGPVQNVVLSDTLPSGVQFIPGSCTYVYDGQSWNCGDLHQVWQANFASGDRITTTLAVRVTAGTLLLPLENCAYLSWDSDQEEICFTTRVAESVPDFTSSYKTGPLFAELDDEIRYTIVAVNTGEAVQNVVLSDTLPPELHFVAGSCTYIYAGQPWGCDSLAPDQMWRKNLARDARITTTFAVTVAAGTGTARWPVKNCAYLSWGGVQHPQCFTTTLNPLYIYLPVVLRNS